MDRNGEIVLWINIFIKNNISGDKFYQIEGLDDGSQQALSYSLRTRISQTKRLGYLIHETVN